MSEGTITSESASETAKPEEVSRPLGKGRNVLLMIVAVLVVIALVAAAFVIMPGKKKLSATIKGDVLQVDAGTSKNLTVVAKLGKKDITNDTGTVLLWSVTPPAIGSLLLKAKPVVPFKAAIQAGIGTVKCTVKYKETPESDELSVVVEKSIRVLPPFLDAVSISPGAKTIQPGENWTFTATAVSSVGLPISGVAITWTVSPDPGVVCTPSATTGPSIRLDAGSVLGNVSVTASGSYENVSKTGTSAVTVGYLPPRSMDYVWYDMFNVSIGSWYDVRWPIYHQEERISSSYPYLFLYHSAEDSLYTYTLMRMNVDGRNVSSVNMNTRPEFLPVLSQTERGGTAVIDWYMQYLTSEELDTRYSSFAAQDDGWIIVLNGTVTLDKQAAKTVLNLTETGFEVFSTWWNDNGGTVMDQYSAWLVDEAERRVDIENAYESYYQLFTFGLEATKVGDKIVLSYDLVTWGMETLMLRWLYEAFLPVEMWYEDMYFHMTIGPEWSVIDIDTAVTYSLYATETMASTTDPSRAGKMQETVGTPCWVFQPALGDAVPSTEAHPHSDFDKYKDLSLLNVQPDCMSYGSYMKYDTVPAAWNLTENETLTFKWPAGNQTFRYRVSQGLVQNVTEEIAVSYSEPDSADANVTVDNTAREIKFSGPLNMYDWSKNQTRHSYLWQRWQDLGGDLLPYGMPWIEFGTKDPLVFYLDHFDVNIADAVPANDNVTMTVTAINNYGFTYYDYAGTVNFTSTDPAATLPANYTFLPNKDKGVHKFLGDGNVSFQTLGIQTLNVTNVTTNVPPERGSKDVNVLPKRNASAMQVDVYYIPAINVAENVTVSVFDQYGDLFVNYTKRVTFSTNRTGEVNLPADYTFQPADAGVHTIVDELTFLATGNFTVTASDFDNSSVNGSQTAIWVAPEPETIASYNVTGIKDMLTRQKSDVRVTAYDQFNKVFKRYNGTIHFSANASGGGFPPDYTFSLSDLGYKEFPKSVTFYSPGVFTVTVSDTVNTSATGSQGNILVEFRPPQQTIRMYDMFKEPWGEWWPWRWAGYKTDIILNNESGKYTMIYIPNSNVLQGIIYAPYRWSMNGTNMSQMSINNPEFMPVLGTPNVPGAQASVDIYMQYLTPSWWDSYWKPYWNFAYDTMGLQLGDGWYPGVIYNVTMNRQAAEQLIGLPQTAVPRDWWNVNGGDYIQKWRAWIDNEGNKRLDIWKGFEWPYIDAGTKMKLKELPDGKILLQIGHLGEGYEILTTRWLNETNLCNHEAYFEDMSIHLDLYSRWTDFTFDAVCQYSLRAVKANESATNEPAWAWQPLLVDYIASWDPKGGYHPSKFDPWANVTTQSWNAGDPNFGEQVAYDSGVTYFNLTDYQTFIIEIPKGNNNLGYYAQPMHFTSISRILRGYIGVNPHEYDGYPKGDGTKYNYTAYWPIMMNGTMSLGWWGNWTGPPDLDLCYDPLNNTVIMKGPMNFDNAHHPNGALYWGAPWIEFNVSAAGGGSSSSVPNAAQSPPAGATAEPAVVSAMAELVSISVAISATMILIAAIAVSTRRKD